MILRLPILALAFGLLGSAAPAAAKTAIVSHWLDRTITIDGELDEWRDALVYVKSVDAFVALFNDNDSLYLCVYSQNPGIAEQFAADGLRARFDRGKDGSFVVDYRNKSAGVLELRLAGQRDPVTVAAGGAAGIEAGVSHRGSFVYEIRLPLAAAESHPWALNLRPGDRFKLVLENPQIDNLAEERAARENRSPGSSPFDPGPGGRNDPGIPGRSGEDAAFFDSRFVFLLKARVELAAAP